MQATCLVLSVVARHHCPAGWIRVMNMCHYNCAEVNGAAERRSVHGSRGSHGAFGTASPTEPPLAYATSGVVSRSLTQGGFNLGALRLRFGAGAWMRFAAAASTIRAKHAWSLSYRPYAVSPRQGHFDMVPGHGPRGQDRPSPHVPTPPHSPHPFRRAVSPTRMA